MPSTPLSSADRLVEAGCLARRQIDLRGIAGHDHPRILAETREEHLHLHGCRVLRLVEQNAGIGQRPPAHESEGRDLDHAGLQAALDGPAFHEIVQRVEDRPQIGIDLLAHVAGQEAETLAGLDGRAREDDALDMPLFEQRHGMADGEPGLARAGGAFREHEFVALQRAQIGVLRGVARAHQPALARRKLFEGVAGASAASSSNNSPCSAHSSIAPSTSPSVRFMPDEASR